ncbi:MAG: hypothetical protein HQ551_10345 [Desulfobacteraceae bacterium]|nr:hypothetical protein [Desulfobacteraceae bacterium]
MSRAQIVNGVWIRNIPKNWQQPGGVGRTDIFKSVLADPRLKVAEYRFVGGPTVRILKEELKRVVEKGVDHYSDQIWGPFNIDHQAHTVNGLPVEMQVL